MKREELKEFGLTDEQIDKIMAEHGMAAGEGRSARVPGIGARWPRGKGGRGGSGHRCAMAAGEGRSAAVPGMGA